MAATLICISWMAFRLALQLSRRSGLRRDFAVADGAASSVTT